VSQATPGTHNAPRSRVAGTKGMHMMLAGLQVFAGVTDKIREAAYPVAPHRTPEG